jgi:hypothetical protein
MEKQLIPHRRGFSTLMALAVVGVLLILVTSVASVFIREMQISRTFYDDTVAGLASE